MSVALENRSPAELTLLDFHLPAELEAGEPPEARGLARDGVRLLVSYRASSQLIHTRFDRLPDFLAPGDLLVINTSGTMNAALPAQRPDGSCTQVHLSTRLPADLWTVELREGEGAATRPLYTGAQGETLTLPSGGSLTILAPYRGRSGAPPDGLPNRLWVSALDLPLPIAEYLTHHGAPIRYSYVTAPWPSSYYQTVYATDAGSAEMPSAGRAFTAELLTRLVASGVQIAPLLLHTGVASLETQEPPYEEYYRVPPATARLVNVTRAVGKRVVAVGTTVVRALETVTDDAGIVHPGEGWTELMVTGQRGVRAVDALLTGLHEPRSTHLAMLEAFTDRGRLAAIYAEALHRRYLWHEFGDLHVLLP